jgi:mono/diheme cytochrome c family protein
VSGLLLLPISLLWIILVPQTLAPQASASQAQEPATPPAAPPAVAPHVTTKPNPIKPTPESQAHAKKMWGYECAMCHGLNGDGKGDLVDAMKLTVKDYTNPASLKDMSDGEMFDIIKNGKGQMPGEGDRAKTDDVWNLVIYIRSLSKKPS